MASGAHAGLEMGIDMTFTMRRRLQTGASALALALLSAGGTRQTGLRVVDSPAPIQVVDSESLMRSGQTDLRLGLSNIVPSYTAQAFITTDLDDNQITAFHPGAMDFSHHNSVSDARDVHLAVIALKRFADS